MPTKDFNQYSPTYKQDVYLKTPLNPDVIKKGYLSKDSKGNIIKIPGDPNYGKGNSVVSKEPGVAEGGSWQKEGMDKYGRALPKSEKKITTDATGRQTQWDSKGEGTPVGQGKKITTDATGRQTQWDSKGEGTPKQPMDFAKYNADASKKSYRDAYFEDDPKRKAALKSIAQKEQEVADAEKNLNKLREANRKPANPSHSFLPNNTSGSKSGRDWDKNPPVSDSDVIRYEKEIGMPKGIGLMDIEKMPDGPAKEKALKQNSDFHKQADSKKASSKSGTAKNNSQNNNSLSGVPKLSKNSQGTPGGGDGKAVGGDPFTNNLIDNLDASLQSMNPFKNATPGSQQASNGSSGQAGQSGGWNNGGGMQGGQGGGSSSSGGSQMPGALIGYLKKKAEGLV